MNWNNIKEKIRQKYPQPSSYDDKSMLLYRRINYHLFWARWHVERPGMFSKEKTERHKEIYHI